MSVSYLLAGHWPYHTGVAHPNEYLQQRLVSEGAETSILEQVLARLQLRHDCDVHFVA